MLSINDAMIYWKYFRNFFFSVFWEIGSKLCNRIHLVYIHLILSFLVLPFFALLFLLQPVVPLPPHKGVVPVLVATGTKGSNKWITWNWVGNLMYKIISPPICQQSIYWAAMCLTVSLVLEIKQRTKYSHVLHKNILVNDRLHIQQPFQIIIELPMDAPFKNILYYIFIVFSMFRYVQIYNYFLLCYSCLHYSV